MIQFLLYQSEDGSTKPDMRLDDQTFLVYETKKC